MRKTAFGSFVNRKKREAVRQLRLLKQVFEQGGFKVDNFLETASDDDPYIYCHNPTRNGSFDGVRIYKVGDTLAFRIQKESKTHPYGDAYPLPIEEIFHDFLSDDGINEVMAGRKVMESVNREVRRFFERSLEAERDDRHGQITDGDRKLGMGDVLVKPTGTDYSSLVYTKSG